MLDETRTKTLDLEEGYNLIYAKNGSKPKVKYCFKKNEVIEFLVNELDSIDFISINDRQLNINEFIKGSKRFSRLLKLNKL